MRRGARRRRARHRPVAVARAVGAGGGAGGWARDGEDASDDERAALARGGGVARGPGAAGASGDGEVSESDLDDGERSIKLGLGDFVFYSVLVSKAALYGFTTSAACFLVILFGLGATLVLLSVFQKALPALPISIGLGVLFYLLTRVLLVPYLEASASVVYRKGGAPGRGRIVSGLQVPRQ